MLEVFNGGDGIAIETVSINKDEAHHSSKGLDSRKEVRHYITSKRSLVSFIVLENFACAQSVHSRYATIRRSPSLQEKRAFTQS